LDRESFEQSEKHVLYREYLRILARYLPPVFVMENVQGLLSATHGGGSTFARMISDLSSPTAAARECEMEAETAVAHGLQQALGVQ